MKLYAALKRRLVCEICIPFDVHNVHLGSDHRGVTATIDSWEELRIPEDLRVHTRENLWSLFNGFRFPEKFVSKGRNVFTGEEVFLFGLYRLSHPGKYDRLDIKNLFGFNDAGTASKCFYCFLKYMVNNWGYLLTNNVASQSLSRISLKSLSAKSSAFTCFHLSAIFFSVLM